MPTRTETTTTADASRDCESRNVVQLPWIQSYGDYASGNYGAHCLQVRIGEATVWFSYSTPVAFRIGLNPRVVRQNDWKQTTGKHLNMIDGGDKKSRVDGSTFERLFNEQFSH